LENYKTIQLQIQGTENGNERKKNQKHTFEEVERSMSKKPVHFERTHTNGASQGSYASNFA